MNSKKAYVVSSKYSISMEDGQYSYTSGEVGETAKYIKLLELNWVFGASGRAWKERTLSRNPTDFC